MNNSFDRTDKIFNFVLPASSDEELEFYSSLDDVDKDHHRFADGPYCWSLQSYLVLRQKGAPASYSRDLVPGAINLAHFAQLLTLRPRQDAFVVCLQADYPQCLWADLHFVQNKSQIRANSAFWVPHWPQPGLIRRDPKRQKVMQVAYCGRPYYLAGSAALWRQELKKKGVDFLNCNPKNCNDLSQADVLIAIRSFDRKAYDRKPPSKLINAWHANIPLIAGHDSAFKQIGNPGKDYILVETMKEAMGAILRLRDDPDYYNFIVENGKAKAQQFTRERIAKQWIELLQGPVLERYGVWRRQSNLERLKWRCRVARWYCERWLKTSIRRTVKAFNRKK